MGELNAALLQARDALEEFQRVVDGEEECMDAEKLVNALRAVVAAGSAHEAAVLPLDLAAAHERVLERYFELEHALIAARTELGARPCSKKWEGL